jgi:ATP synthase, F1 epsilon subunit (delta in mitochondria)
MADTFQFELVTPAAPMVSEPVELVIIPGAGGNFGVLPGHAPLLSTLRPGVVEIRDKALAIVDQIFVDGGFAEVTPERTTVLAEEAVRVCDISREDAEERLKRAHDALMVADTFGVRTMAERDLKAAEAMVQAYEAFDKSQGKA